MEDRFSDQPESSDEALMRHVVQRDVEAFGLLYDRYARPVYTMAAHMLGHVEAEEIVQDVFLRVWNRADQFDASRGAFNSWLMAIARNRVLDELRHRSRRHRLIAAEKVDQTLANAVDPEVDVEHEAWLRASGDSVLQALKRLPAEQRRALVLAYFGGLSHSAMAEHLGWPLGTVKKRIRLGLQKLRAFLGSEGLVIETTDPVDPRK